MLHTISVLAQEHAEEGTHNPLIPQLGELIYGSVAFLILFGLLSKFVFPALNKMLEERRENIEGKLEQAERDRREAEELRARRLAQLEDARDEADRIIEEARRRGEESRAEIVARAEAEAARKLTQAEEQIAAERERAIGDVRRDVGELAVLLAERIVGESMNGERQQRVVARFVEELAATGTGQPAPAGTATSNGEGRTRA